MVNPFEELAQAIILQAVKDYRLHDDAAERDSIEQFFRSRWFGVLTNLDPEMLISRLRRLQVRWALQKSQLVFLMATL